MPEWLANSQPPAPHPFPHSLAGEGWIILSGLIGLDPATGTIPEDAGEQARLALAQAQRELAVHGAGLDNVVYIKPYVTAREHLPAVDAALRGAFSAPRPASGAMTITELVMDQLTVEFELWARIDAHRVERGES